MINFFSIERCQYISEVWQTLGLGYERLIEEGAAGPRGRTALRNLGKTPELGAGHLPHHLNLCQVQKK